LLCSYGGFINLKSGRDAFYLKKTPLPSDWLTRLSSSRWLVGSEAIGSRVSSSIDHARREETGEWCIYSLHLSRPILSFTLVKFSTSYRKKKVFHFFFTIDHGLIVKLVTLAPCHENKV
jgi:hypothetical protein